MIADLLAELRRSGIELRLDGDKLVCKAPRGVLTPELQERIRVSKPEIMSFLRDALAASAERPQLRRISRNGGVSLGIVQQRMWLLDRLDPGTTVYNLPGAWRLTGALNVDAFRRALAEIVRRHEVMRTRIDWRGEGPVQIVEQDLEVELPLMDLTDVPAEDREARAVELMEEERDRLFDLSTAPLWRARLYRLGDHDHVFFMMPHHVIWDGWSFDILHAELAAIYPALAKGKPSPLPDLSIQYIDYVSWHREWMQGAELGRQLDYWRNRLQGELPVLQLPTDRPRPPYLGQKGIRRLLNLDASLIDRLRDLGRREGATLFMVLLAAYKTLLFRYTGQTDLIVGAPIQDRLREEAERLIGVFVNTLVLRTSIEHEQTFRQYLRQVRDVCVGAYAHQDVPFEFLVEEFQGDRSLSHTPLYQTLFTFQDVTNRPTHFGDLTLSQVHVPTHAAPTDVLFGFMVGTNGTLGVFDFNAEIFEPATMDRIVASFEEILEHIVSNPDESVSNLRVLSQEQRYQIVVEWNDNELAIPAGVGIHDLVQAQARRTPDAVALIDGKTELSYRDLMTRANGLAHRLRKLGVGPETLVGVCLERSADLIVSILGVLKSGGAYVPLDPKYPAERLRFMLADSKAKVVVTDSELAARLPDTAAQIMCLDTERQALDREPSDAPPSTGNARNLAYVIYTSGSTGTPKGVAIEHRSTVALLAWAHTVYQPEELSGVLASTSVCFDLSVFEMFLPLTTGGAVILAADALALPTLPAASRVTLINTVPSAIAELVRNRGIPSSVTTVNLAGEPLSVALVNEIYEAANVQRVYDLYGPSEDTTYSTWTLRRPDGPYTIGRPIANTQAYVLDRHRQPVPVGVPGEIYLGGMGLARGYLDRPELTAERFVPNPFSTESAGRMYRTGDLARWRPDGTLEFLGRIDNQVKVRGFRIELGEIESALTQHAAVAEAVVVVRYMEGADPNLVAYVVLETGHDVTASEMRRYLRDRLPEYMVPNMVVQLDALPLSPNGKIDRRALPDPFAEARVAVKEFEPPTTDTELEVARIWQSLLGVQRVGRSDNFFELGGHSLLSMRAVAEMQRTTGRRLDPRAMFFQTLEQVASQLGNGHGPR